MQCVSAVFAVTRCPSVCLSCSWITSKRLNISSNFFSPSASDTILVFPSQRGCRYSDGNPPNGGVECKGYDKMTILSQISRCISQTVIVRWAHAARQFVSIEFSFHPYNIYRDCPGASPGKTKMWTAVRENGDFFTFVDHVKTNKHMFEFFSPSRSRTILVYRSYIDTKHRAAFLRQQSFLFKFKIWTYNVLNNSSGAV